MSDEKDPVLAQIESDARKAVKEYPSALSLMYEAGAYNQDAIAWNRCLDEVTGVVRNSDNVFEVLELIEKMRR